MAVRADVTVDFTVSPRIATVASPSVTITAQDLYDTLATIHARFHNLDDLVVISSAGKAALGGAKFTGITNTLQNCQLAFEERTTPVDTGTATTANAAGTTLIDSAATFQTTGIVKGDVIVNFTDRSMGSVTSVDSETQLTHTTLAGGTDNDWDVPDAYQIYRFVACTVTDGDLVAVDGVGSPIDAIFKTFGTNVQIELSTSPALIVSGSGVTETDKDDIRDRVWNALTSNFTLAGSMGKKVGEQPGAVSRGVALADFPFIMRTTAGVPAPGLTVSGFIRKDGGAEVALTNTVAEMGNGAYKVTLTGTELNAVTVQLRFTAVGATDTFLTIVTSA